MDQPKVESRTTVAKQINSPLQLVDREFFSIVRLKKLSEITEEIVIRNFLKFTGHFIGMYFISLI
ncbi:hypothetical protein [Oceanobacillus iheyensis]|uniref:hypothetical protein n=1 Tax=Oceanobacillus iheyensis TaxID=182710 RepID=UPI0000167FC2|nr:hypothetical protein [Oceanobacillus iheyensis]